MGPAGAQLSVLSHPGEREERFELPVSEGLVLVLGRGAAADIELDDTRVSRRHARIEARNGRHFIEDLGSVAGTGVNGLPAQGSVELCDGDRVQVGATNLLYSDRGQASPVGRVSGPSKDTEPDPPQTPSVDSGIRAAGPDETVTTLDSRDVPLSAAPARADDPGRRYKRALVAVVGLIGLLLAWMLIDPT